jgi:16S rRNA processing protein RimM
MPGTGRSPKAQPWIVLAVVGAPHGVKGEVRLKSFAADPMSIRDYGKLFAEDGRAFEIERMRPAKDILVAKFRGGDDRAAAAKLTGLQLGINRSALPPAEADEFYHADLIGLEAFDASGKSLGHVVAVHNYGAGDIIEIAPPKRPSMLVPFTKANVPDIDIAAGRLVVVPPTEIEVEPSEEEP